MSDLISRQDAIAVADYSDHVGLSVDDVKRVTDEVVKGLRRLPSADAVEVVRCGYCKYYKNTICQNPNGLPRYLDENEFCSNGKRREDGKIH